MNKFGRIALKTLLWIIGSIITLLLLIIFLIRIPSVQNYVVGKVTNYVENKINTPVRIGYINIEFPTKIVLENIYFEDQSRDTLLAGEKLKVDISMFKLLKNTVEVQDISLHGITAKINRTLPDSTFNFDYIVNAFVTQKESTVAAPDTSSALVINLDKILFEKVHFVYNDEVIGTAADIYLKQFKTEIRRFDLAANMAFAMPKVKIDGLNATIKQWAPMTAANAPKAADFGLPAQEKSSADLLPIIDIETADLSDILLRYEDASSNIKTKFIVKKLLADINSIDLNKEFVEIDNIELDGSNSEIFLGKIAKKSSTDTNSTPVNWVVSANSIKINNSDLWFKDDNQSRMKGFDYGNINIKSLTADLQDLYYAADSIAGSLKNLSARDHSGFQLKKLKGDFYYKENGAEIKNLYAETPNTILRDYIRVSYPSLAIITEKPELIKVDARINKSRLGMKDVYYFAPFLDTMQVMKPLMAKTFFIDGRVNGQMNNLNIPSVEFKTLNNTHIIASAKIVGLPAMDKLKIDLNLKKLTTGRGDLEQLIAKSMLPSSIQLPKIIGLKGTFNGGLQGFKTNMALNTEQGAATVNGNFSTANRDTIYDAELTLRDFNIGNFLKQDSVLGMLSFDARIKGRGLDLKKATAEISGEVLRLDAMGYKYHNMLLDVQANAGDIIANVKSDDRNIDFDLQAQATMMDKYPQVNFNLMVDSINLKSLKLMDQELRYHGNLKGSFETADLNFLNGRADIINSSIAYNSDRYQLDSISLIAKADSASNLIMLQSDFLKAHLVGKYKLTELGNAVEDIIHTYYEPADTKPIAPYAAQNFEFSAQLSRTKFIKDFLPSLTKMDDITLDGIFDSESKTILAKLNAPSITYAGTEINEVSFDINAMDTTMYYSALVNKIKVNKIELINTVLSGKVIHNNLDFGLWIKDKMDKEQYHLGASMEANKGDFFFRLLEDGLVLNYDKWNVSDENHLHFGKSGIHAHNFVLSNAGQQLEIASQDSLPNSPLDLTFKNFRIETLTEMIAADGLEMGGGINGAATISRLESKPTFVSDLLVEKFYFGKDTVGNINIKVDNEKENTYAAAISISDNGNDVQLLGEFISPPVGESTIDATLSLKPLTTKTIEAFSFGYLKGSEGGLSGDLKITGTMDKPAIAGKINFEKVKFNVAMLNADFKIDQQAIAFNQEGLQFTNFDVHDKKDNELKINGTIKTKNYIDYAFNLDLTANDFEVVNSTRVDNDLFFGKMYISSKLRVTGDLDKPVVDGNIVVNENTDFAFIIPNDDPGMVERKGVVEFVDKSDTSRANVFAKLDSLTTTKLTGMDVTLNLQTSKDAKFKIIIDEGSQDALNIQGVAEINAGIDASNKITMSGTYTVNEGDYSFNFGPVKRVFNFKSGSSITWAGDPLDARLNITASYKVKAPTLELVQNQIGSASSGLYKQRIPFDVNLLISEQLFQPKLDFDITIDEKGAIASQDVISKVNTGLSQLKEDPSEMNKQVFSLIVLGRFMASNPFESVSGGGGVESMARNSVSSLLSSQLNKLASDLIQGVELDFDLQSSEDYTTGIGQTRTDLNIGISKMLFDDRLKVTIGSNFEIEGKSRPGEQSNNIAGDISLDYQLSKDGRYFARVYRKNQYQATLQGQFVETGIGFIINMDYNKFKEIWMNSKKIQALYNQDSRGFRKRFDVTRMDTDSLYRDSVRLIIRDSLMKVDPEFRQRIEEREKQDSLSSTPSKTTVPKDTSQRSQKTNLNSGIVAFRTKEEGQNHE